MSQTGPSGQPSHERPPSIQPVGDDGPPDRPPAAQLRAGEMASSEHAGNATHDGQMSVESGDRIADVLDPSSDVDSPADVPSAVRVGSPFAVDPRAAASPAPAESLQELGPMKYTAMGAVSASMLVVGFAAAAAYFFPAGGTLVAALGCLLSILGMYSSYRFAAACLLTLHLCLFVLSYGRSLS